MAIEHIRQNLYEMQEIVQKLKILQQRLSSPGNAPDTTALKSGVNSMLKQLEILNNAIPELVKNESGFRPLYNDARQIKTLAKVSANLLGGGESYVTVSKKEKEDYIKELHFSSEAIKKIFIKEEEAEKEEIYFETPRIYVRLSNKFFSGLAMNMLRKGYFSSLKIWLKKANMPYMLSSYLAMAIFSSILIFIAGAFIFIFSLFFNFQISFPFIATGNDSISAVLLKAVILLLLPVLSFFSFYYYPIAEEKSISKKIEQELPFVVIHLAAIGSSGVEPSRMFSILAMEKEYPYTRIEMKKIVNQVNLYGYDIVSALKESAHGSPSLKLAELFNGIANNISTGGDMGDFLKKRAESLLFDYRLEREKYTRTVETLMNLYISVVISAPMMIMILIFIIGLGGFGGGYSNTFISIVVFFIIALINFMFFALLRMKQPTA